MKRLFVLLALALAPSAAWAQIDNSALECDATRPTYWPRGDRWTPTPSVATVPKNRPIGILFQPEGPVQSPSILLTVIRSVVMASFNKWSAVTCAGGGRPDLSFTDAGEYPTRDGGDDVPGNQFKNVVYWVEDAEVWRGGSATVALTWNYTLPTFSAGTDRWTGPTLDGDMELNGIDFTWRARSGNTVYGCTAGSSNCFDLGSVSLHEAGHFVGFNHVQCADAVMFPTGSGTGEVTTLSAHEVEGVCRLYPPRPATASSTVPLTYEQCNPATSSPCAGVDACIQCEDYKDAYPLAWCAKPCTTTADCPPAYVCLEQSVTGTTYCSPGVNFDGSDTDGGTAPPGDGQPLCAACASGDQCLSGLCVDGGDDRGICTVQCVSTASATGCPEGFDCIASSGGPDVCWPQGGIDACGETGEAPADTSPLNALCYQVGYDTGNQLVSEWFQACAPGLICIAFKPHGFVYDSACISLQEGACVLYCSPDRPCPSLDGSSLLTSQLTCCYGVDENGQCLGASIADGRVHGGCFDIRREGEACVSAEESVCESGTGCYNFGDAAHARCFRECPQGDECAEGQTCEGPLEAVCSDETVSLCGPPQGEELLSLGMACTRSAQCDSGLCQQHDGAAACSRACDLVTSAGCPGDVDINGDAIDDGGFRCLALASDGSGRCWPIQGPVEEPRPPGYDEESSGCCSAVGAPVHAGDLVLGSLVWLPLVAIWRRRRR